MILVLIIALFISGAVVGAFVTLVIGIHKAEHRMNLSESPEGQSRSEIAARRVLNVNVRNNTAVR